MTYTTHDETLYAPPAEVAEPELYHPKTFIGKYIWSQDAKVIAVQYGITAIAVGLIALCCRDSCGCNSAFRTLFPSSIRATTFST